ncbi:MAG: molybdenum cofactor biosynthesis protein MoaE [Archaeoglobaceae archaeon]
MKIFIPENWNELKSKLDGKFVEIWKDDEECEIISDNLRIRTPLFELKNFLEFLCDLGFEYAALIGFDGAEVGIEVKKVKKIEDLEKAKNLESLKSIIKKLKNDEFSDYCGAIGIFVGFVRKISEGKVVKRMEYEAYEEALERAIRDIEDKIWQKFDVKVKIYHKTGALEAKEDIVYIVVMGRHRKDIWNALMEAVENMKSELPIWKKEVFDEFEVWVHDKEFKIQ